jgi:2-amino-4-hydroxy-6-hydroxymethyldihydropteridine diphosphokinase
VSPEVRAFIGIGANLGDARATVSKACRDVGQLPNTRLLRQSSLYATAPLEAIGPDFVNAVVEISTMLTPQNLLDHLHQLEANEARTRPYRNAPRTLDLDVLLYADEVIKTPTLSVPHPRMFQRAFVLVPLAEIAPEQVSTVRLVAVSDQVISRLA